MATRSSGVESPLPGTPTWRHTAQRRKRSVGLASPTDHPVDSFTTQALRCAAEARPEPPAAPLPDEA